jgi:hypothetical protein
MLFKRMSIVLVVAVTLVVFLPLAASAQGAFSGVVRDPSGAVLPGVTVEASSPVLIEQVRSVVTDEQGRYTIVDLRPGTYKMTFSLTGFSTLVRDGVELPANVTVPMNIELRVGALEETLTVTAATPLVDVQNAQRTQVLGRDVIDSLPITRNSMSIGAVMPGIKLSRPDVGGSQMMEQIAQTAHGSLNKDLTLQVDGMMVNSSMNDNGIQAYNDDALNQEVSMQTTALPAEVSAGGPRINMIPKDGGDATHGAIYAAGTPQSWQSSNIDDNLRAQGIKMPNGVQHVQDFNGSMGGPILRNRLWYFGSGRHISVNEKVTNAFYPDGRPAIVDQYVRDALVRLTGQASSTQKVSFYFQRIWKFKGHELNPGYDVVTASDIRDPMHALYYVSQAKYTATLTPRMLLEAGFSTNIERLTQHYQPGIEKTPFTSAWYAQAAKQDVVLNTLTNAALSESYNLPDKRVVSSALTYVTGTHNIKAGFQWAFGRVGHQTIANADLVQVYRAGAPDSVRVYNTPAFEFEYVNCDCGIYAQDAWVLRRLTINAGVRFEHFNSQVMDTYSPAGRFVPARHLSQADMVDSAGNHLSALPNWNDWAPRLSGVYDLFGNARTAVKGSVSKYMTSWAGGFAGRYNPFFFASDQRSWTDLNHDDIAQDNEIGPTTNNAFGVSQSRFPDPNLRREYSLEYAGSVQHQLTSRLSLTGGFYHRKFSNTEKLINTALSLSDYTSFVTTNPQTGAPITIYNLNLAKLGQVHNVDSNSTINRRMYTGLELSFNGRLPGGANVFGGWTAERIVRVSCDTNDPNKLLYCDQTKFHIPFRNDFKFAGNYPLPAHFEVSAIYIAYAGNQNASTNSQAGIPTDGSADPSQNVYWVVPANVFPNGQRTQSVTVPLIQPGTQYLKMWKQLDLEVKRIFRVSHYTISAQADVYNALNSNVVLVANEVYGPALGQPLTILQGRIFRATMQLKF